VGNFTEKLKAIWKDSVGANVIATLISTGILAAVAFIWFKLGDHTVAQTYDLVLHGLAYKIPVYIPLLLLGTYLVARQIIKRVRKPKRLFDPIWDEIIGNYTFSNLFEVLTSEYLVPLRREFNDPFYTTNNLMYLFFQSATVLSRGVKYKVPNVHPKYLFHMLCPQLLLYELVDRVDVPMESGSSVMEDMYLLSDKGKRLHALFSTVTTRYPELYEKVRAHKLPVL
jgi:hypothetical protein